MSSTITGVGISVTSLKNGSPIRLTLISEEGGEIQTLVHKARITTTSDGSDALSSTLRGLLMFLPQTSYKFNLNFSLYLSNPERAKVLEALRNEEVYISSEIDNDSAYFASVRPWQDHPWQNDLFLDISPISAAARISVTNVEEGIRENEIVAEASISNGKTQIDTEEIILQLVDPVLTKLQATTSATGTNLHSVVVIASSPTDAPKIVETLRSRFSDVPVYRVTQEELGQAVAQRALELAKQGTADLSTHFIFNVAPLRIGIAKADGFVHTLIPHHFTLPNHRSSIFTTSSDNQTTATIKVVAGHSPRVNANTVIAELALKGLVPQPKGVPRIRVTLDVQQLGETEIIAELVPEDDGPPVPKAVVQLKDIVGDMTTKDVERHTEESQGEVRDVEAEKAHSVWAGKDVQGELPQ